MKKFLSGLICLVLVVGIFAGAYFLFFKKNEPSTATSVMTMDVNPSVQFVLDQNNKVMNVTAVNEDGIALLTQVNFEGMSAEQAAKLFIEVASKWKTDLLVSIEDYTNEDISKRKPGITVTINISCDEENKTSEAIENLKTKVANSVNKFFTDNGIVGGAQVVISDLSTALENFGIEATELAGKTYEELIAYAQELSTRFENIEFDKREEISNTINGFKEAYQTAQADLISLVDQAKADIEKAKADIEKAKADIEAKKEEIKNLEKQIKEAKETFKNSALGGEIAINTIEEQLRLAKTNLKEDLQPILDAAEKFLKEKEAALQEKLDELQPYLEELQAKIDAEIEKVQKQCEEALETIKTDIESAINDAKNDYNDFINNFKNKSNNDKTIIKLNIEMYQQQLQQIVDPAPETPNA